MFKVPVERSDWHTLSENLNLWKLFWLVEWCLHQKQNVQVLATVAPTIVFNLGLVSKVFPAESVVAEAMKLADKISEMSIPVAQMCKESVNNGLLIYF